MGWVAGGTGIVAAKVDVDEAAVDVTVVVPGVPATVAIQCPRQIESACDVATTRHVELPLEVEFASDPRLGQATQFARCQAVGEVQSTGGCGFALGRADRTVPLDEGRQCLPWRGRRFGFLRQAAEADRGTGR